MKRRALGGPTRAGLQTADWGLWAGNWGLWGDGVALLVSGYTPGWIQCQSPRSMQARRAYWWALERLLVWLAYTQLYRYKGMDAEGEGTDGVRSVGEPGRESARWGGIRRWK